MVSVVVTLLFMKVCSAIPVLSIRNLLFVCAMMVCKYRNKRLAPLNRRASLPNGT